MNKFYYETNPEKAERKSVVSIRFSYLKIYILYFSMEQLVFSAASGVDPKLKTVRIHEYIDHNTYTYVSRCNIKQLILIAEC